MRRSYTALKLAGVDAGSFAAYTPREKGWLVRAVRAPAVARARNLSLVSVPGPLIVAVAAGAARRTCRVEVDPAPLNRPLSPVYDSPACPADYLSLSVVEPCSLSCQ